MLILYLTFGNFATKLANLPNFLQFCYKICKYAELFANFPNFLRKIKKNFSFQNLWPLGLCHCHHFLFWHIPMLASVLIGNALDYCVFKTVNCWIIETVEWALTSMICERANCELINFPMRVNLSLQKLIGRLVGRLAAFWAACLLGRGD